MLNEGGVKSISRHGGDTPLRYVEDHHASSVDKDKLRKPFRMEMLPCILPCILLHHYSLWSTLVQTLLNCIVPAIIDRG